MAAKIDYGLIAPAGISRMLDLGNYVRQRGLRHRCLNWFQSVRSHFSDKVLLDVTLAIVAINGRNRLAVSFRALPRSYTRDKISTPAEVV